MGNKAQKKAILVRQQAMTQLVLLEQGFLVLEAKDCLEGVRLCLQHWPDLIIADINSPDFGGLAMLQVMQLLSVPVPLVLTGFDPADKQLEGNFENLLAVLMEREIESELGPLLLEKFGQFHLPPQRYSYQLSEHEWCSLLSCDPKPRLLIAEGSDWFRKLKLMRLDQQEEFYLFSAQDGISAVLKALLVKPDLILADLALPGIDGPQMSQLFYIFNRPFPILFLVAQADLIREQQARNIQGVLGVVSQNVLREEKAFLTLVRDQLKMARTLKASLEETYDQGGMEELLKPGEGRGLFMPGSGFMKLGAPYRPNSELLGKVSKNQPGLGGLVK